MVNYTFPRADINLQDVPVQQLPDPTILPLHLPLFLVFAERGPVGEPILGGANALTAMFGSQMLNERSPFFQHPNVFLKRALQYQQVYMARICDPAAVAASLVVLCTVTPGALTQYQRTSGGAVILDGQGAPLPKTESDMTTIVTEPGVTLSFTVRALTSQETISGVQTATTTVNGHTVITYPLIALQSDVGTGGNSLGINLFYNPDYDANAVANMNAMTYNFNPVSLNTTTNIETPIYDVFNSGTQIFAFPQTAYDPDTATYYSLNDVVTADFNGVPGLPYQFHVYGANATAIAQAGLTLSPELGAINPNLINIFTGVDAAGNTYEHIVVDGSAATTLNSNVVLYLRGGTDGVLTKTELESLTVAFVSGETNPQIGDSFRYPFTHIYDSGYALATKQALAGIFSIRDDVKLELSTQDVANQPNTAAQDQSTGSALRTAMLLNLESIDFGTQACRAAIYQQCGLLSDTQVYNTIVPATIDRMIKRCLFDSADHIKGEPKGRPNSEVSILKLGSINWTPSTPQQEQLSWSTGLNYIQYCDVATLFYADLRSIYPIDTSLLSSDVFVDFAAVYLKHLIREQWTIFAGRDDPPKSLFQEIASAIDNRVSYVFGGRITTTTVVSQTAIDTALGYQTTVTTTVLGSMPNRVWKVIVPVTRAS